MEAQFISNNFLIEVIILFLHDIRLVYDHNTSDYIILF